MLGRGLADVEKNSAIELLHSSVLDRLKGGLVTGNLECLLAATGIPNPFSHTHLYADFSFAKDLLSYFDVLTLANNHIYDLGDEAIAATLSHLQALGIQAVGVGKTTDDALRPAIIKLGARNVAVFGITAVNNITPSATKYIVATPNEECFDRIKLYCSRNYYVIVHLHAGGGDTQYPSPHVINMHKKLSDQGVSLVLGHHPHKIQGWHRNEKTLSFFSLGDFVFDKTENGRDQALIVTCNHVTGDFSTSIVQRNSNLEISLASEEVSRNIHAELSSLGEKIEAGEIARLYATASKGIWLKRLKSLFRDFRAGGLTGVRRRIRSVILRKKNLSRI